MTAANDHQQTSADKLFEAAMWARLYRHDEDEARELAELARLYREADEIVDELRKLQQRAEAA